MPIVLADKQRVWQMKARQFAAEVLHPAALSRDAIDHPAQTFDWEIIRRRSKLGFRTAVVAEKWGGHGIDFVTQALVMAELAKGDSAMAKTFSQCWKWSHLIAEFCTQDQKERFLKPFMGAFDFAAGVRIAPRKRSRTLGKPRQASRLCGASALVDDIG